MKLNELQQVRLDTLLEWGVDIKVVSETLGITEEETILFLTDNYTYDRFCRYKLIPNLG